MSSSSASDLGSGSGGGAVLVPASASLSSSALASLESAARAHLSALSQEREHHSLCALLFLLRAQRAAARTARALQHMQGELNEAERALIDAETHCSALQECTYKIEETRRFLVNRVKCAQWEKKSHFHLTAIDHMLGNVQPALFDVATMLRGHLRICAVARASMQEQQRYSHAIQTHQEVKERSFHSIKSLLALLATAKARHLELRHIAAEVVERVGGDLERFLERKRRGLRRGGAAGRASVTSTPASALTSPAQSAGKILSPAGPGTEQRFSAVAAALASAAPAAAASSAAPLQSPLPTSSSLPVPLPPLPSVPISSLFHDPDALDAELAAHGISTAVPAASSSSGEGAGELELALGLGLGAPFTAAELELQLQQQQGQTPRPATPVSAAAEESFPPSPTAHSPSPSSSLLYPAAAAASYTPSPSHSPGHSPSGSLSFSNSPPGAGAWAHLLGSAPPASTAATSVLMATVAAEDVWPASLDAIAAEHVEQLSHPIVHGSSSHADSHAHTLSPPSLSPTAAGRVRRKSGSQPAMPSSALLAVGPDVAGLAPHAYSPEKLSTAPAAAGTNAAAASSSSPPASPSSSSAAATSARQGYIAIKMRYYAQLGHNQAKASAPGSAPGSPPMSPGANGAPPLSPGGRHARSNSAAAALALLHPPSSAPGGSFGGGGGGAGGAARRRSEGHRVLPPESPPSQSQLGMSLSAPVSPSSPLGLSHSGDGAAAAAGTATSASLSPSSSFSASSAQSPLAAVASQSPRSRAILARSSESEGESSPNKRWMLRPLPANTTAAAAATATSAATASPTPASPSFAEPSASASPSSSSSSSPSGGGEDSSSAAASSPPAKRPWWKAIFSPRSRASSGSGTGAGAAAEESFSGDKKSGGANKRGVGSSGPALSPLSTSGAPFSAASSAASVAAASVAAESLPPLPANEARLLGADWAALNALLDSIESANARQQRAWEVLESVLDKRERAQAEERRAAKLAAEAAAVAAATAAADAERARAEEAQSASARLGVNAGASVGVGVGASTGTRPIPSSVASPRAGDAVPLSPKVQSSHSVSSSSPLLASSSSSSSLLALSPPGGGVAEPAQSPQSSGGVSRPHRKSVLSVLQGVPAPTLMPAFAAFGPLASGQFDAAVAAAAGLEGGAGDQLSNAYESPEGDAATAVGSDAALQHRSLPLSVPPRPSSVSLHSHAHAQSRSVPSTPAAGLLREQAGSIGAEGSSAASAQGHGHGHGATSGAGHARRASDSAAPPVGRVKSPRSAPATVRVRSSSFSFALALQRAVQAHHAAVASGNASASASAEGGFHPEFDADFAAMLNADRSRQSWMQHHSPPSPSSLVF